MGYIGQRMSERAAAAYDIVDDFSKINLDDLEQMDRYVRSKTKEEKAAKSAEKYAIITYFWTENRGF